MGPGATHGSKPPSWMGSGDLLITTTLDRSTPARDEAEVAAMAEEYPRIPVRRLRPDWWMYLAGGGIDRWVQIRGLVPARTGPWGLFCARDGQSWSVLVDPDRRLPASGTRPD